MYTGRNSLVLTRQLMIVNNNTNNKNNKKNNRLYYRINTIYIILTFKRDVSAIFIFSLKRNKDKTH